MMDVAAAIAAMAVEVVCTRVGTGFAAAGMFVKVEDAGVDDVLVGVELRSYRMVKVVAAPSGRKSDAGVLSRLLRWAAVEGRRCSSIGLGCSVAAEAAARLVGNSVKKRLRNRSRLWLSVLSLGTFEVLACQA